MLLEMVFVVQRNLMYVQFLKFQNLRFEIGEAETSNEKAEGKTLKAKNLGRAGALIFRAGWRRIRGS